MFLAGSTSHLLSAYIYIWAAQFWLMTMIDSGTAYPQQIVSLITPLQLHILIIFAGRT